MISNPRNTNCVLNLLRTASVFRAIGKINKARQPSTTTYHNPHPTSGWMGVLILGKLAWFFTIIFSPALFSIFSGAALTNSFVSAANFVGGFSRSLAWLGREGAKNTFKTHFRIKSLAFKIYHMVFFPNVTYSLTALNLSIKNSRSKNFFVPRCSVYRLLITTEATKVLAFLAFFPSRRLIISYLLRSLALPSIINWSYLKLSLRSPVGERQPSCRSFPPRFISVGSHLISHLWLLLFARVTIRAIQ